MQLTNIGELFATRKLELKLNDKNAATVEIKIGKPQNFPDGEDYYCAFQIIGLGDEEINWAGGIDAIQALLLALENIGVILKDSKEYQNGNLTWIGSDRGNLGFPQLDSSGLLRAITHLNKHQTE